MRFSARRRRTHIRRRELKSSSSIFKSACSQTKNRIKSNAIWIHFLKNRSTIYASPSSYVSQFCIKYLFVYRTGTTKLLVMYTGMYYVPLLWLDRAAGEVGNVLSRKTTTCHPLLFRCHILRASSWTRCQTGAIDLQPQNIILR